MRFSGAVLPISLLASAASATHYDVTVGKDGQLQFVPPTIDAKKGDTITYNFFARNHSVIQSSFDKPCQPLAGGGIFSGFVPTDSPNVASRTTFTIEVEDEKPIWIYCGQTVGNHCQNGMVHAINAPKQGNTFEAFKELAAKTPPPSISPLGPPTGGIRKTTVDVGINGTLTYSPNSINEIPGTVVEFKFNPQNHTVTQSSFDKPCKPLNGDLSGFSSGFVKTTKPDLASFFIEVKDTKPIWFYCGQVNGNHCQSGMVGAINPPATGNTLQAFIDLAKKAPPPSVIPPKAPLGGALIVKDILIKKSNLNGGNAIDVDAILGLSTSTAAATATATYKPYHTETIAAPYNTENPCAPPVWADKPSGFSTMTKYTTATATASATAGGWYH